MQVKFVTFLNEFSAIFYLMEFSQKRKNLQKKKKKTIRRIFIFVTKNKRLPKITKSFENLPKMSEMPLKIR